MKAIIISVGDELVAGITVDTNCAHLARRLGERGIEVAAHHTVADDRRAIAEAITSAAGAADVVVVTGGLGPTADDLTRQALADALGVGLELDEQRLAEIEEFFAHRGRQMQPGNRVQAMSPAGAESLANPLGTAPGIAARLGGASIYVLPGVPHEMAEMFDQAVAPRLATGDRYIVHREVHCFGQGESDIAARIADLMARGANPTVGTTASGGMVTVRIAARGGSGDEAGGLAERAIASVRERLDELVVGVDGETMAEAVGRLLRQSGRTVATAESCTGGRIGWMLTAVPGSSDYYLGGVVAYSDDVKWQLLEVRAELLKRQGAVSKPVAGAMAAGCRRVMGADFGLSVTGIAGPGGGSDEKPLGLVYIGLAGPRGVSVHRHVLPGTRDIIRLRASLTALNHLRLELMGRAR